MRPSPEFLLYVQELRSHPVTPGFPAKKELTPAVAAADEGEAQESQRGREVPLNASCAASSFFLDDRDAVQPGQF